MNFEEMLHNRVREINANLEAVKQAAAEGERAATVRPISGGLGHVIVDGTGSLVSVDLDRQTLGTHNGRSLARHLLTAIQQAESTAIARRDALVGDAKRRMDSL